jgi:hypothetical protein
MGSFLSFCVVALLCWFARMNFTFALLHFKLQVCIVALVGRRELHMLCCYVVAFKLLVATFLNFWLLHCYILPFNLLGFPFLFCPFN